MGFQETHKLLQPADKVLKTMAIEFAEYQVRSAVVASLVMDISVNHELIWDLYLSVLILCLLTLSGLCWFVHYNSIICRHCFYICHSKNYGRPGKYKVNSFYLLDFPLCFNSSIFLVHLNWATCCILEFFYRRHFSTRCTTITRFQLFLILLNFPMICDGMSQGLKDLKLLCVLEAAWLVNCMSRETFSFLTLCMVIMSYPVNFMVLHKRIESLNEAYFIYLLLLQGLQVQEYSGNFCKRIPTDVDLPAVRFCLFLFNSWLNLQPGKILCVNGWWKTS